MDKTIINRFAGLSGRYVPPNLATSLFRSVYSIFPYGYVPFSVCLGESVQGRDINMYSFGEGDISILMWSQMHGNESTTTKAIFDLLYTLGIELKKLKNKKTCNLKKANLFSLQVLELFSKIKLHVIPQLNPDGAEIYTRENANKVDLNRDLVLSTQPETKCLKRAVEIAKPSLCFNLHDQRSIFSAGKTSNPATISFLSPAADESKAITSAREQAMSVINIMNEHLQGFIPNCVGRFSDDFNINCSGDYFTSQGIPTILVEAGHFKNDYDRDKTRIFVAEALLAGLLDISKNGLEVNKYEDYFNIPSNEKLFYDIILLSQRGDSFSKAFNYQEKLIEGKIHFVPRLEKEGELHNVYAHRYIEESDISEYNRILQLTKRIS